ncbi:MAG: hypothetical protein H0W12_00820 [Chitinophagaceae bacterium]|nr:hypothetical protein [Chitinophagaceae bacterium]
MGLDNIQLPPIVLQEMFKKTLVELHVYEPPLQPFPVAELQFLGSNKQHIALLINMPGMAYLADDDLQFLTDVLMACKLNLEDVAILNITKYPLLKYTDLAALPAKKIILFGITYGSLDLPFNVPEFQIQKHNSIQYLAVPALKVLQENIELKRKFWKALQNLFAL